MTSTKPYDVKILLLMLIGIPFIASVNIDCGGASFYCLNSTHFRICVDLGGGMSTTVDDYVIRCPAPTVCSPTNRFECEFPQTLVSSTTAASTTIPPAVPITLPSATNESESATTLAWEEVAVTAILPHNTSVGYLELQNITTVSIKESLLIDVTTSASVINNRQNETVTELVPIPNTTYKPQITTTNDILVTDTKLLNGTEIIIDANINRTTIIPEIEVITSYTTVANTLNVTNININETTANPDIEASSALADNIRTPNVTENNINDTIAISEVEVAITTVPGNNTTIIANVTKNNINETTATSEEEVITTTATGTNNLRTSNVTEDNIVKKIFEKSTEIIVLDKVFGLTGENANQTSTIETDKSANINSVVEEVITTANNFNTEIIITLPSAQYNQALITEGYSYVTTGANVKETTIFPPETISDTLFNVNSLVEDTVTSTTDFSVNSESNVKKITSTTLKATENGLSTENNLTFPSKTPINENTTTVQNVNVDEKVTVTNTTQETDVTYNTNKVDAEIFAGATVQIEKTNTITTVSPDIVSNSDINAVINLNSPVHDILTLTTDPSIKTTPTASNADIINTTTSNNTNDVSIISSTFPNLTTINDLRTELIEIKNEITTPSSVTDVTTTEYKIMENIDTFNTTVLNNVLPVLDTNANGNTTVAVETRNTSVSYVDSTLSSTTDNIVKTQTELNFIKTTTESPHDITIQYPTTFSELFNNRTTTNTKLNNEITTENIITRVTVNTNETVSNISLTNETFYDQAYVPINNIESGVLSILDIAISEQNTTDVTINETSTTDENVTLSSSLSAKSSDVTSTTDNYQVQITTTNNDQLNFKTATSNISPTYSTEKTEVISLNETNVLPTTNAPINLAIDTIDNVLQSNNTDNKISNNTIIATVELEHATTTISVPEYLPEGAPSTEDQPRRVIVKEDTNTTPTSSDVYSITTSQNELLTATDNTRDYASTANQAHKKPQVATESSLFNETRLSASEIQTSNKTTQTNPTGIKVTTEIATESNLYNDKTSTYRNTPMSLILAPKITSVATDTMTSTAEEIITTDNNKVPEEVMVSTIKDSNNPTINSQIFNIPTTPSNLKVMINVNPDLIKTDINFHSATPPTTGNMITSKTLPDNKVPADPDAVILETSSSTVVSAGSNTNFSPTNIATWETATVTESIYSHTQRPDNIIATEIISDATTYRPAAAEESSSFVIKSTESLAVMDGLFTSTTNNLLREIIPSMLVASTRNPDASHSSSQIAKDKENLEIIPLGQNENVVKILADVANESTVSPNSGTHYNNITNPLENVVFDAQDTTADQNLIMSVTVATTSWNAGNPISTATESVTNITWSSKKNEASPNFTNNSTQQGAVTNDNGFNYTPSGAINQDENKSTLKIDGVTDQSETNLKSSTNAGILIVPVPISDTNQKTDNVEIVDSSVTDRIWSNEKNEVSLKVDNNLLPSAVTNQNIVVETFPLFPNADSGAIYGHEGTSTINNDGVANQSETNFESLINTGILKVTVPISVTIQKTDNVNEVDSSITDRIWSSQKFETSNIGTISPDIDDNLSSPAVTNNNTFTGTVQTFPPLFNTDSSATYGHQENSTINNDVVTNQPESKLESLSNTEISEVLVPISVTIKKADNLETVGISVTDSICCSQKSETQNSGRTSPDGDDNLLPSAVTNNNVSTSIVGTSLSLPNIDTGTIYRREDESTINNDNVVNQSKTNLESLTNTGISTESVSISDISQKPDNVEKIDSSVLDSIKSSQNESQINGATPPKVDDNLTVSAVANNNVSTGASETLSLLHVEEPIIDNDGVINQPETNIESLANTGISKPPVPISDTNQKRDDLEKVDSSVLDRTWSSQKDETQSISTISPDVDLSSPAVNNNNVVSDTGRTLPLLPNIDSGAIYGPLQESTINMNNNSNNGMINQSETNLESLTNKGNLKMPVTISISGNKITNNVEKVDSSILDGISSSQKNEIQGIGTPSPDVANIDLNAIYGKQGKSTNNNDGVINQSKSYLENLTIPGISKVPFPIFDKTQKTDNVVKDGNAVKNFQPDPIKNKVSNVGVSLQSTASLSITTSNATINITEIRIANSSVKFHRAVSETNANGQPSTDPNVKLLPNSVPANTTLLDDDTNLSNNGKTNTQVLTMSNENVHKDHHVNIGNFFVQNSSYSLTQTSTPRIDTASIVPMFSNPGAATEADIRQTHTTTEFSSIGSTNPVATTGQFSILTTVKVDANVKRNLNFDCQNRRRGRYSDNKDCRKFYVCIGMREPIEGLCPVNTVFSDIKKQCTKNQSYCIRENKFQCVRNGRFSDFLENNVYFICVKNHQQEFVRFKFQCQSGYYLNKIRVRCVEDIPEPLNQSTSYDSDATIEKKSLENSSSNNRDLSKTSDSSYSTNEKQIEITSKQKSKSKGEDFQCEEEGRFPDPKSCERFYVCSRSNRSEEYRQRRKKCDSGEVFHKDKKKCVDADSFECS